jgi:hypothetical protein
MIFLLFSAELNRSDEKLTHDEYARFYKRSNRLIMRPS